MRLTALAVLLVLLTGCVVGPKYKKPTITTPAMYRTETAGPGPGSEPPLGNEKWWEVFQDPVLQQLIRSALEQNYDARIAAERVLQAEAQLGITRANQFPMVGGGVQLISERNPKISSTFPSYQANVGEVTLNVIWNLDFWGKYRRQTEAARANLLATEWGRRSVLNSVVSSVASAYFQLRELDAALQIAKDTLESRQNSLRLTNVLAQNGSASLLDVRQSEELVYTAGETIPDLDRQIAQQENLLSILLGQNPGSIARGRQLTEQPIPASVPPGLPSELLERRPDIKEAEQNLIAANANIGVAKAEYFPNISLTGAAGFESYALSRLFTGSAGLWNATLSLAQPVFEGGGLRSGVKLAEAQQQQRLLAYKQAIATGFQQVSDGLIAFRKNREFREQQERLTRAAQDAERLSNVLYQHGGASYLQVLTAETNSFAAQLNLTLAQLSERLALVQLYNALGGGWQP